MQTNAQNTLVNTTAGFPAPKTWGISGLILVGTLEDFVVLYAENKVHLIEEAVITYNDREWLFVESYTSDEEGDPVDFQFKLENGQEMIINEEGEVIAHSSNPETWDDFMRSEEDEVEPWMVKLVDKALICGEKEFKVVVPTYQHRNDLLAYYKPIYKESETKVLLKIRVLEQPAPPKAEVPTIEYNNLKSLIEQINGIKRAKVLVSSEDIRRELIAQYQPMYKEVGCFLAVEVK